MHRGDDESKLRTEECPIHRGLSLRKVLLRTSLAKMVRFVRTIESATSYVWTNLRSVA